MRAFIASVVCALTLTTAWAQKVDLGVLIPSPLGIGITIAQWIVKDSQKIFYVEVVGQGPTFEQAKQHALGMAVERAVGTAVLSEAESVNAHLYRNEIVTYASGFVQNYQVVGQRQHNDLVQVELKVWVGHSALKDRLLNISRDSGMIEGDKVHAQIQSLRHERSSADKLLSMILADYPHRAFDLRLEPTRVRITDKRTGQLEIPFVLSWNSQYLASLTEAVSRINQKSNCDTWFSVCRANSTINIVGRTKSYFDDSHAYDLMHKEMIINRSSLRLTLLDDLGRPRFQHCYTIPEVDHSAYSSWRYVELGGYDVIINPHRSKRFVLVVDLQGLPTQNLDQLKLELVRLKKC